MLLDDMGMWVAKEIDEECGLIYWEPSSISIDWAHLFVVRDPWDRLESCYADKLHHHFAKAFLKFNFFQKMPFEEFIEDVCEVDDKDADRHFRSQTYTWSDDLLNAPHSFIFQLEDPESWQGILDELEQICGIKLLNLPHLHSRKHSEIVDNPRLRGLVRDRYSRDYQLLGY